MRWKSVPNHSRETYSSYFPVFASFDIKRWPSFCAREQEVHANALFTPLLDCDVSARATDRSRRLSSFFLSLLYFPRSSFRRSPVFTITSYYDGLRAFSLFPQVTRRKRKKVTTRVSHRGIPRARTASGLISPRTRQKKDDISSVTPTSDKEGIPVMRTRIRALRTHTSGPVENLRSFARNDVALRSRNVDDAHRIISTFESEAFRFAVYFFFIAFLPFSLLCRIAFRYIHIHTYISDTRPLREAARRYVCKLNSIILRRRNNPLSAKSMRLVVSSLSLFRK